MSAGLILQYLFPTILLPAMAAFPLAVAGKSLAASGIMREIRPAGLWVATCILAWGGTAYILLVPAGGSAGWLSWYIRLVPVVASAIPAGMLWAKHANRKWLCAIPTAGAFIFLSILLTVIMTRSFSV